MNNRFIKPPLSKIEKEKKAADFLNFSTEKDAKKNGQRIQDSNERVLKKEAVQAFLLRFPLSMAQDLTEISALTGISRNAVCLELLRSAVREKLKELKSQGWYNNDIINLSLLYHFDIDNCIFLLYTTSINKA